MVNWRFRVSFALQSIRRMSLAAYPSFTPKRLWLQVNKKSQALAGFLSGQPEVQRRYAALQLANKLVSQCEVQAGRLPLAHPCSLQFDMVMYRRFNKV